MTPLLKNGLLVLLSFTLDCITCGGASSVLEVVSKDGKISTNAEPSEAENILNIGQGAFIGICVAAGLVILIVPIVCCFCCGCLCFAGRKNKPQLQAQPSQVSQHHQQQQQPYAKEYPPFNNQLPPPGAYQQQQQQQQQQQHQQQIPRVNAYVPPQSQQHPQQQQQQQQQQQPQQFYNANVQQSNNQYPAPVPYPSGPLPPTPTSPGPAFPMPYQDAYSARPQEPIRATHPGDPNLVVNRFNSKPGPQVPPKPVQRQRFPGWTNVTKEVKKRNQLKQMQDDADGFEYVNDGYNGGSRSPTPL